MSKILLIGNSGLKHNGQDGQTVKVRLYLKKIQDEGFEVCFVDLENFIRKPISSLYRIKKGIKSSDRIVLITAERGSKILIPFINHINKHYKKPFVFPLVGTNVLHSSIDKLNPIDKNDFLLNGNYSMVKENKKVSKQLALMKYVLPETDLLVDVFKGYYHLDNVFLLNNFRECFEISERNDDGKTSTLKIVFLSRVMKDKGVFDLINCVNEINSEKHLINLDIYGGKCLSDDEDKEFGALINKNVCYKGQINNEEVLNVLSNYDLFVFPTRLVSEGTPGVIVESLLAGTPVLTSNFPQARYLLDNGKDSLSFNMFDKNDLKDKLLYLLNNRSLLVELKKNAIVSGKKYTYEHERARFLKYICGVEGE